MRLTERDKELLLLLASRGWCSIKFISKLFPSRQAAIQRIQKLEASGLLSRESLFSLLKNKVYRIKVLALSGAYYSPKTNFVRISPAAYKVIGIKDSVKINERIVVHQVYQEFVEQFLSRFIGPIKIESNPLIKPRPDLFFEYSGKRVSVEIERRCRKPSFSSKKELSYQDYIDRSLQHADCLIYLFESKEEMNKFLKNKYSKRVFVSLIDSPDVYKNYKDESLSLVQVLNAA